MSSAIAHPQPADTASSGAAVDTPAAVILAESDHCVACGLCLPRCPTYRQTGRESESPRGRIALARALAEETLQPEKILIGHLDNCLTCRACEAACPSRVAYGRIIDNARALIAQSRGQTRPQGWLRLLDLTTLVTRPERLRRLGRLLRLYQLSGLQTLARRTGLLKFTGLAGLEHALPKVTAMKPWREFYPASAHRRGAVALFTGCLASVFDRQTLDAGIAVLTRLGYDVHVPANQGCCGALHQHAGDPAAAAKLAAQNITAFDLPEVEAIIVTASGCGAMLAEYPLLVGDPDGSGFSRKVRDINGFIAELPWTARPASSPHNVVVHDPCTLANVVHGRQAPYTLLERIPGVRAVALPDNGFCCGAAGSYQLDHPDMAERLRAAKIEALVQLRPQTLVTSNMSCAIHLAAGARETGLELEVVHPVVLLARYLREQEDELTDQNP